MDAYIKPKSYEEIIADEEKRAKIQEEKKQKEKEDLEKYLNDREERYVSFIKDRVYQIIQNESKISDLENELNRRKTLFWFRLSYNNKKEEKNLFNMLEDFKLKANLLAKYFLKISSFSLKKYFENFDLNDKKKLDSFINFIIFSDNNFLIKLIIQKDFYENLNDDLKKIFYENSNEFIKAMIVGPKSSVKNSATHKYWREKFQNLKKTS